MNESNSLENSSTESKKTNFNKFMVWRRVPKITKDTSKEETV